MSNIIYHSPLKMQNSSCCCNDWCFGRAPQTVELKGHDCKFAMLSTATSAMTRTFTPVPGDSTLSAVGLVLRLLILCSVIAVLFMHANRASSFFESVHSILLFGVGC